MEARTKTLAATRLLVTLILGLGLTLGLLWALVSRSTAEAQAVSPGIAAAPVSDAVRDQAASDDVAKAAQTSADTSPAPAPAPAPPRDVRRPPEYALPHDWGMPPHDPWEAGGAPLFASIGDAPGVRSLNVQPLTPPLPGSADLVVCMTTDRVWGVDSPGGTFTVTVNGTQMGAALANDRDFFWTTLYDGNGDRPGLSSGNTVAIYRDGNPIATVDLITITGQVDVVNDVVSGTIGGVSSSISVTIYAIYAPSGEPSMTSYSQTVSTDGSGNFTADFTGIWDFVVWNEATVAYIDGDVEVHQHVYPGDSLLVRPSPWNEAMGHAALGTTVTASLHLSDTTEVTRTSLTADSTDGWYYWSVPTDVVHSDIIVIELADGTVMSRTVDTLSIDVDAANDRVTGEALSGATVRGMVDNLTPLGWRTVQTSTTAPSPYTLEFSSIADIMPGEWAGVFVADAEGDDLNLWAPSPSVEVNQTHDQVYGRGPSPIGPDSDRRTVTLTLASTTTTYAKEMDEWAWYWFDENDGLPDIAPGEVVTVEAEGYGWQGVVQVQTMTVQADPDTNQFTGTVVSPTQRVELSGHYYQSQLHPAGGQFDMLVTASSPFAASPPGFDVNGDLYYDVVHRTADDYAERISRQTDGIGEVINANGVGGVFNPPGVAYTITLYNSSGDVKTQATGNSGEPTGGFWMNLWDYGQEQIEVGDYLQGQSAAGFTHTVQIPALSIIGDPNTDVVSGQGPANVLLFVSVDNQGRGYVPSDGSGQFTLAVDQLQEVWGDGDLQWGDGLTVVYYDERNTWLVTAFAWPRITVRTNMDGVEDVIGNNAFPGNTIYITVTDPGASLVATGTTEAGACEWAGPTDYCLEFPSGTLVPSNTVTVDFGEYAGSVYVDSVEVVTLTGQADVDFDIVTGTAPAEGWVSGWGEDMWGSRGPDISVQVDASGVYTLDFGAEGWDMQYGDSYHVYYAAPHGHEVEYYFWLPAPELSIDKWNTSGHARPGGVVVYGINYWNDGNGVATDTLIVDTLPMSTSWAGDTSGVTPIQGAGVITWNLGNLAPGDQGAFMVTLDVSGTVPTGTEVITRNCAIITTTAPGDYNLDNNGPSCTDPVNVEDDDVEVEVQKWPNPDDPTPGQEFEYTINWCNNRGAAVGPAWLTDTLPLSTTFLSWSSQNWQEVYWTEVVTTGGQLVFYAPGLPGDMCQELYLRLLLDAAAQISTTLENTVVISAAGDVYTDNDGETNTDAHVSSPRYDMRVNKSLDNGQLVPGGRVEYGIGYQNQGNAAVHVWVTDTLPTGTSFDSAWTWGWGGGQSLDPAVVTADYVVWDLGVVGVNEGDGFGVRLNISNTVAPFDVLTNCATVGITQTEDTPWDNESCVATTIYTAGLPNLYVTKELRDDYEPGHGSINYRIRFGNLGDQTVYNVHITDTFPISTTYDWHNVNWWYPPPYTDTVSGTELSVVFGGIEPGWSGEIDLSVSLDDSQARMHWYTNTVEIDTPSDDANPGDNTDTVVVFSGGEVDRVDLWIASAANVWGQAQPNVPITVTTVMSQYTGFSDGGGDWNINDVEEINPGDVLTVTAGAGLLPVIITVPDPYVGYASSVTDTVWGQVGGASNEYVDVDFENGPEYRVPTDGSGNYSTTLADVPRGAYGEVRYYTELNHAEVGFRRSFQTPDLILRVRYDNDQIGGNYEAGRTVWITVTNGVGGVKATAAVSTTQWGGWGGRGWNGDGFETQSGDWSPSQPDIVPGDWVYAEVSASHPTTVHVGTIAGTVDAANDTITGTVDDPSISPAEMLDVECHPWGAPGGAPDPQSKNSSAMSDGSAPYNCSWDPGSEWDVEPGQEIGVQYYEPDGDSVLHGFWEPAADLSVDKYGEGQPTPGGNYVFRVNYHNYGDKAASSVVITDELRGGMTYITDTSGISPTVVGGTLITWDMDTISESVDSFLDIFVEIGSGLSPGDRITNVVEIATPDYETDYGNNTSGEWWTEVVGNDTHLNVGKWAWTGDPAPGYDFVYSVNVCNNGSTGSSQVTLTDTLHLSTTLQSWWAQHPGWMEVVSDSHLLVVSRPSIPGWWCGEVYLRVHLTDTAWSGMSITNTAVITASNDLEGDDNETTWWGNVGDPHTNLSVDKWWNWGQLVPGGFLRYNINYNNNGNLPVTTTIHITDTLPVSTTFREAWYGGDLFTPAYTGTDYVMWEINGLDNGHGNGFEVVLDVDNNAIPGTVLTNTVEISPQPVEDGYDDNTSTWVETIYDHGPNLRANKNHDWENNNTQLGYNIYFENVGSQPVDDIWITDTYPISTTFSGNSWDWWVNHGPWITMTHDAPNRQIIFWAQHLDPGETGSMGFRVDLDSPGEPYRWYTNTVEIDELAGADTNTADNVYTDVAFSGGEVDWVDLAVGDTHIWGWAPNGPITITTPYTWTVFGGGGDFDWYAPDVIQPGDVVTVEAGAGIRPVVIEIPDPFDARASSITDTVWGQIDALDHEWVEVNPDGMPTQDVQTDGSGNYSAVFPDIPRSGGGEVRYPTEVDYASVTFHRRFQSPDLIMLVHYTGDNIEGNYEAGHTVWITVTNDSGSVVKGTAVLTTGAVPWWGGQTGFSTGWQGWTVQPDIVPGDWVYGALDNGYTSTVQVGTITGNVDAASDVVSGTIAAPWFTQLLNVQCFPWGGSPQNFTVDPMTGTYSCDFSPYDVLPGQNVRVEYQEPDGDWVVNDFREPTPYLRIEKWTNGDPGAGSNFAFTINYWNQDGDYNNFAEHVVITDTLLGGMTYVTDTSGVFHTGDGTPSNPLVWDVGTLPGGNSGQFEVFVQVTAAVSDVITNTVEITTSSTYNQSSHDERYSEITRTVRSSDVHLDVGKWIEGPNPAPDTEFTWSVNVCNHGDTASAELTLTDTLPISTTLLGWWGDHPGWTEVLSTGERLVLSYPSFQQWGWCSGIHLRFRMDEDAWTGMPFSNTAVITASNDIEDSDNRVEDWHDVYGPFSNLYIRRDWIQGQPVPGYDLNYEMQYGNDGNAPADGVWLTYTLPFSTTFVEAWSGGAPFLPDTINDEYVAWDLGTVENGFGRGFGVRLHVDEDAPTATFLLTNTLEITLHPTDFHYDDNILTWTDVVNDEGPNLSLHKQNYWWNGTGQLGYEIRIKNRGTERLEPVWITDTYPISTTWNWDWHQGHGPWITATHDGPNRQIIFWVEGLDPGDTASVDFRVDLDGAIHGTQGPFFTNTLEAPISGDVYPADNYDEVIAYAGPDIFIEKWLRGGVPRPGETVTFTVKFGNQNGWQGMDYNYGSHITDTLPPAMTFITATTPWDPNQRWQYEEITGTTLVRWGSWTPWENSAWYFHVVAQITGTAQSGEVVTNVVRIVNDNVNDLDWNPDNDIYTLTLTVLDPVFEVGKVYEGNGVAGTVVTYTLTVTNSGNYPGTNVVLSDTVPAVLTDVDGDGTLVGGDMTWNLGTIAAYGGTATGWFSGTLPCAGTVTNDDYRVVSSDQGVSSAPGAPVAFNVNAPALDANFSRSASSVVVNSTVTFTDTSTTTPGGPAIWKWAWDFGDGDTDTGQTVNHTYTSDGTFTVRLTVTDTCGYSDYRERTVTVNKPTFNVSFNHNPATLIGCGTVNFASTATTNGPAIVAWGWDFDDGSTGTGETTSHQYTAAGSYDVTHIVTDALGYSGTGTVVNAVVVNAPALDANFNRSAASVVVNTTVTFTDTSTTTPGGPAIAEWEWDFGDGSAHVFTQNASHQYTAIGTFTVRLTVTDTCGYSDYRERTVTVNEPNLVADFTYSPSPAYIVAGTVVAFTDASTTDGPAIAAWEWNFGDGSAHVFTQNPSHQYNTVGTYDVTLVVTDALGYSDTAVKAGIVVVSPSCTGLNSVTFTYAPAAPVIHSPVVFTATYAPSNATQPINYTWSFGDGGAGSGQTVQHIYTGSGSFTVVVTATNACSTKSYSQAVTVAPHRVFLPLALRNYTSASLPLGDTGPPDSRIQ